MHAVGWGKIEWGPPCWVDARNCYGSREGLRGTLKTTANGAPVKL
jgi:hypothetical protein